MSQLKMLKNKIEALLFSAGKKMSVEELAKIGFIKEGKGIEGYE